MSPDELCALLASEGIQRFYLVWDVDAGRLIPSHELLAPLARRLEEDARDYDRHEGIFVQLGPRSGVLQGAFVHRTCRGQGAGGVRFWTYDTLMDFISDGLRLARGMTHKNALAGLWWGGGKGVMAAPAGTDLRDPQLRRTVYEEYGTFMSSLKGCYVTAEDVGTSVEDMAAVFSRTRFTTCIPEELGGSGNPSVPTARGVLRGMEAALEHLGLGGLRGKTVAIQGLGHVGQPLVRFLAEKGVGRIIGSDIDASCGDFAKEHFPDLEVRIVGRDDCALFAEEADILAPCATGGVLGPSTIPTIAARIVCGAANNQLEDPLRDDHLLAQRGILYMPDFLVNRMGIVTCADEASGYVQDDPTIEAHLGDEWENSIYNLSMKVLAEAATSGRTPAKVALDLAEEASLAIHPIMGHRGATIIRSLIEDKWVEGA